MSLIRNFFLTIYFGYVYQSISLVSLLMFNFFDVSTFIDRSGL